MSSKKYGIYQIETFEEYNKKDLIAHFFEVSFIDFGGTKNILANSHRQPNYASFRTEHDAEKAGREWLASYLEEILKELEVVK